MLSRLGAREAFGVSGGAMAALWDALSSSSLAGSHFRHEPRAAFASIDARLATIGRGLAAGLVRRAGFAAAPGLETSVQRAPAIPPEVPTLVPVSADAPSLAQVAACVEALQGGRFAIWTGYGARDAAAEILELAHRIGAPVMCSPRGKGIFPEDDPLFVGVTGLAGH